MSKECRKWSEWYSSCLAEDWLVRSDWDYFGNEDHTHIHKHIHMYNLLVISRPYQSCFWLCLYGHVYMKRRLPVALFPSSHAAVFFFSLFFIPHLLPLYFFLSYLLSWCSLSLIVVVIVSFFKQSRPASYQTCNYKKADLGSLASQNDTASGVCQHPQEKESQISNLIWIKVSCFNFPNILLKMFFSEYLS